ncbi:hypothetical protein LSM04_004710 [Trypanosoma melophagium]|uniref:uncharacterized protein n=1 Tax=Trypanosoma melophagium TaxID=715481 RepID=UPI00351A87B3|nr:hypothetical protein LSM04_004710 [Trypanosoma melophagium]
MEVMCSLLSRLLATFVQDEHFATAMARKAKCILNLYWKTARLIERGALRDVIGSVGISASGSAWVYATQKSQLRRLTDQGFPSARTVPDSYIELFAGGVAWDSLLIGYAKFFFFQAALPVDTGLLVRLGGCR